MMISVLDYVENIVGKGENAGKQHFLLLPQCFEKASFPDMSKCVIVWEWVEVWNWNSVFIFVQTKFVGFFFLFSFF